MRRLSCVRPPWAADRASRHATVSRFLVFLAAAVLTALLAGSCATPFQWGDLPTEADLELLGTDEWRADVEFLRSELPRRNPHFVINPEMAVRFDEEAQALLTLIGTVAPEELVGAMAAGISRIIATVGEGHTSVNVTLGSFYPVVVRWLADGLYVAGVHRDYEDILGARVEGIRRPDGTVAYFGDTEGLEPILNSVIAADHPNGHRASQAQVLTSPHLLSGLGLAGPDGLTYLLSGPDSPSERTISAYAAGDLGPGTIIRVYDDSPPLARRSEEANWYTRVGPEGRVLYLHCGDCTREAFGLLQTVIGELKRGEVDRLVVDLRDNGGGLSIPGTWFARQLAGIPAMNHDGATFILIGPRTFSSGMWMAVDLMHHTNALFAGEPLAQRPDSWGEVGRFRLPNSGLVVSHSTRFFTYARGKRLRLDEEGLLVPDAGLHLVPTLEQYRAGVDPALDAALGWGGSSW